jgi:serine protease Do
MRLSLHNTGIRVFLLVFFAFSGSAAAEVTGLPDFTTLVEKSGPAVVNIRVTTFGERARQVNPRDGQPGDGQPGEGQPYHGQDVPEFFRRFFDVPGQPGRAIPDRRGAGSGFIFEEDGYIITNHHVIEDADEIIVRMADRREFEAELVGSDEQSDIALLKIDADDLPALKFGDSNQLRRGEWVAAIGSPFNFDQTVTAGIVSAKGRSNNAQQYVPFIQTDVAINQGNSGGPLLNMDGEVVGINSWILSASGGYIGLSFAIPIEVAASTIEQLRNTGRVQRGLLGVTIGDVTREMAEAMNLDRPVGALVNSVNPDSAAERAGILPGDVILEFNGVPVELSGELPPLVGINPPGTEAEVLVSRNGRKKTFDVTLDALEPLEGDESQGPVEVEKSSNVLGLAVESISAERRRELGDPEGGVVISEVENDAAWRAGIRPGDIILMINNQSIDDLDGFEDAVEELEAGRAVALRLWRNGNTNFIAFTPTVED